MRTWLTTEEFAQWHRRYTRSRAYYDARPTDLTGPQQSVLLAVKAYRAPLDGPPKPPVKAIAEVIGIRRTSVQRALAVLRAAGHLS